MRRGECRVAWGLMVLALLGCEDDPGPQLPVLAASAGMAPVAAEPRAPLSGLWGMHTSDTDYVAAQLSEGPSGTACYDGWPVAGSDPDFVQRACADIFDASIEGRRVRFTFEVSDSGGLRYTSDVFIARDAARMAGTVTVETMDYTAPPTRAVWLPMTAEKGWLASDLEWPQEITWPNERGGYELTLQEPAAGSELVVGRSYRIERSREGLVGDLGAFYASELEFTTGVDGELVLDVGPVAETEPNSPIRLALHFAGPELKTVEAETPAGIVYTLSAKRRPGW